MPRFRSDIASITQYVPGRSIGEVALDIGIDADEIVKLASNESPEGPFPGVVDAVATVLAESNRYPDDEARDLTAAVSKYVDVPSDHLWFGAGSTSLLSSIALTAGGPGTSAVYGWPSFVMYRIISKWSMTEPIEVPLDDHYRFDLESMRAAVRPDTTVVYVCNPNNPTGTVVSGDAVAEFVDAIPDSVLVVIDEAYYEFVSDPAYRTGVHLALSKPNVIVLRTFSKVFALAAHRVGYAIARPETLTQLRKAQQPFSVSTVAHAAATASLGQPEELQRRIVTNAAARHHVLGAIAERGLEHAPSETNFAFVKIGSDSPAVARSFEKKGVIIRPMSGGWQRITFGREDENELFIAVLDELLPNL